MAAGRARVWIGVVLTAALVVAGCTGDDGDDSTATTTTLSAEELGGEETDLPIDVDPDEETAEPAFAVSAGTETATVTGAEPGARLSLVDADGKRLIVLKADEYGQAHFAYVPSRLLEFQTGNEAQLPSMEGSIVEPGGYTVRAEDETPVQASETFTVLGRDDAPDGSFFDDQAGDLVPSGDQTQMFGYVTTRDGVKLSVMVRLPGPASAGPYPTVIEYSGYGVSNPANPEPGSMIAGLLGYATVGVNMRGSGCSGGVFDVFNTAQQTDGYDVVEAVARQPWVKHNEVGMVGLSYSGITQLYTAATNPPSLAGVTSLSVIKDPWLQQWPGGVYNGGFTKQWLEERDRQSSAGGSSWVQKRIDEGDETCEEHQQLREQNIDFEAFGRSLERRPAQADGRDLSKLVENIDVPVYLSGAWQDEQTGPQFADMLGNFTNAPVTKFVLFNGRHPDGYTPINLSRWYEFLELYVNRKVPKLPDFIRTAAPAVFEDQFGVTGLEFEPDRFGDFSADQYDEARSWYESTPDVRVLFDQGADEEQPGTPGTVVLRRLRHVATGRSRGPGLLPRRGRRPGRHPAPGDGRRPVPERPRVGVEGLLPGGTRLRAAGPDLDLRLDRLRRGRRDLLRVRTDHRGHGAGRPGPRRTVDAHPRRRRRRAGHRVADRRRRRRVARHERSVAPERSQGRRRHLHRPPGRSVLRRRGCRGDARRRVRDGQGGLAVVRPGVPARRAAQGGDLEPGPRLRRLVVRDHRRRRHAARHRSR